MSQSIVKTVVIGSGKDALDISDRISKLVFKESVKRFDYVELEAAGEDAEFLLDLEQLAQGRLITFSFGFIQGDVSPTHTATITEIEPEYSGSHPVRLSVKALDKGITSRNFGSNKIWKNVTTDEIIKAIADKHSLEPSIQNVGAFRKWDSLPQGNMSDMDFLKYLAIRESGGNYVCYTSDGVLYFQTMGTGNISASIVNIKDTNMVKSFRIRYKETTAHKDASGITSNNKDGNAKVNPATIEPKTVLGDYALVMATGSAFVKDAATGNFQYVGSNLSHLLGDKRKMLNQSSVNNTPDNSVKGKSAVTESSLVKVLDPYTYAGSRKMNAANAPVEDVINSANFFHKKAKAKVLTASLVEYGNPLRKMNTVVTVIGIATRFVGNWYIETVTHTVDKGYETVSELNKDGLKKGVVKSTKKNDTEGKKEVSTSTVFITSEREVYKEQEGKTLPYNPTPPSINTSPNKSRLNSKR